MLSVRIWYVWHYPQDYYPNWEDRLAPGMRVGLSRLSSYTGSNWALYYGKSFQTSQPIGGKRSISADVSAVWRAIREFAQNDPDFQWQYRSVDLPVFLFANTRGAFSVDYHSPIYGSDNMPIVEASSQETLVEHEVGHAFGLPDHMKPFTNPEYNDCIMGNLYLGRVKFCSECRARFVRENYRRASYEQIAGLLVPEINFSPGGAYATWAGQPTPQRILPSNTWPANTEVYTTWHFSITGNTPAVISFEFFGTRSGVVVVDPGESGVAELTVPPLSVGSHQTVLVVRIGDAVFREPFSVGASSILSEPVNEIAREAISVSAVPVNGPPVNDVPVNGQPGISSALAGLAVIVILAGVFSMIRRS